MKLLLLITLFSWAANLSAQTVFNMKGRLTDSLSMPIGMVEVFLHNTTQFVETNSEGIFSFKNLPKGTYTIYVNKEGYTSQTLQVEIIDKDVEINILILPLETFGPEVEINLHNADYGVNHFRAVDWDNMVIGAAKKSEIIDCGKLEANLAANNSRQIYAKVAGLNIWENDNSGIQLNIGGRGLSPNRTSNFNTRQNGYDISADALGYPESYYTPPAQALERIEIIRGAASLQYGTQFGGMLNFRIRKGKTETPFEFTSENTYGSFNFFNSFNSIGGTLAKGKVNYYGYYQYKRGDGWRPYSEFGVHNGYFALYYQVNNRLSINFEQTLMQYAARQPGGLTDLEFSQNPRQSKRPRNWFRVDWRISSLNFDYKISERTKLNVRNFGLFAERESLGNLTPINRVDYGGARDLIKGAYRNFGNETRLLHRYKIANQVAVLLGGVRLYKGFTTQAQGYSNADTSGTRSDFSFAAEQDILRSDYRFPSFNTAAFVENYFTLGKHLSITPGIRYEYIRTASEGYYQDLLVTPSADGFDTLRNEAVQESRALPRSIFLAGVGVSYRIRNQLELYGNLSQNYRAVNFNDMRILNPNQEVNPNLQDESGFNTDLGFRGKVKDYLSFDVSLFYLAYKNRIGNLQVTRPNAQNPALMELVTLRTNIGDARVLGLESLVEWDIWRMIARKECERGVVLFANFSWLDGRYTRSDNSYAVGKKLELVPPMTLKTGLTLYLKEFRANYQVSYTARHFSDATNAESAPNAVVGVIPSYYVMDASLSYVWKWFRLQAGCNNLLDTTYFTRRAVSYPGPGILPADGRSFYLSLRATIGLKQKAQ